MPDNRGQQRSSYGITPPISTAPPTDKDLTQTASLQKCLEEYNLFESQEMLEKRIKLLNKLNDVLAVWVKDVSVAKQIPEHVAKETNGKIFTFGSYRLGVHPPGKSFIIYLMYPYPLLIYIFPPFISTRR